MCWYSVVLLFFCFKQKTAYEMRISDWSSDVCSSDLSGGCRQRVDRRAAGFEIGDHLGRDGRGKGADAVRGDAVIAGEDRGARAVEARALARLPAGEEDSDLLQPP